MRFKQADRPVLKRTSEWADLTEEQMIELRAESPVTQHMRRAARCECVDQHGKRWVTWAMTPKEQA